MRKEFLIGSKKLQKEIQLTHLDLIGDTTNFQLFAKNETFHVFDNLKVLIDGYVLPRNENRIASKLENQASFVTSLYRDYGENFYQHLKGIFCIVIVDDDKIIVLNDHLGINKFFYTVSQNNYCISNSFRLIAEHVKNYSINFNALAVKAILNHEVNGETIVSDVCWSKPATSVILSAAKVVMQTYWKPEMLVKNEVKNLDFEYFASLIKSNVENITEFLHPENNAITITGGKDSRTALAALLSSGIRPFGITYGNPQSRDAVFAKLMAEMAGILHEVINPDKSMEWFDKTAKEIIGLDNPLINIHRSHRYFALKRIQDLLGENTAYYGGYMGGELLMGIYYDNLIFTNFLTKAWEKENNFDIIPDLLNNHFIKKEAVDLAAISDTLSTLKTVDRSLSKKMKQFHGLFEIGILHHSQDVQIAAHILDYPIPFFLDLDFIEALFASKFSFLYHDSNSKNPFEQHRLFEFNLNIQHILYPILDSVPFAKKGSYNTKEFLQGTIYWSVLRSYRYFKQKQKYPPTFTYNEDYKKFIVKGLNEILMDKNSVIHDVYDVSAALNLSTILSAENQWHRFSNIVMHYLQIKDYKK